MIFDNNLIKGLIQFLKNSEQSGYAIFVITIACLLTYTIFRVKYAVNSAQKTKKNLITNAVVNATYLPIIILIWINVIVDKNGFLLSYFDTATANVMMNIKSISFVWIFWLTFSRLLKKLTDLATKGIILERVNDKTFIKLIRLVLITIAYIIMVSLLLRTFGIQISSILTMLGGTTAIVAFASQEILKNALSGILIMSDGTYKVGDFIQSLDKKIDGQILKIGIRTTKILMADKQIVSVPNQTFNTMSIINLSNNTQTLVCYDLNVPNKVNDLTTIIDQITTNVKTIRYVITNSVSVVCNNTITNLEVPNQTFFVVTIKAFVNTVNVAIIKDIKQKIILTSFEILEKAQKAQEKETKM